MRAVHACLAIPLLLLASCGNEPPYTATETMPQCIARLHLSDPQSAPIGLHNACLEFVSVADGGQAEVIHPPQQSASGAVMGALAAGLIGGLAVGAAASHSAYNAPPPVVTTTCHQLGYETTCTSY